MSRIERLGVTTQSFDAALHELRVASLATEFQLSSMACAAVGLDGS